MQAIKSSLFPSWSAASVGFAEYTGAKSGDSVLSTSQKASNSTRRMKLTHRVQGIFERANASSFVGLPHDRTLPNPVGRSMWW